MKEIQLTHGKVALVDDEDFEFLNQWKWCYHNGGYAVRADYTSGKHKLITMHRVVNKTLKDLQTDHINRNKLDNRKENLRSCTSSENNKNTTSRKGSTSKYLGVSSYKRSNKWKSNIWICGKSKHLGYYISEKEAALAYNEAALKYHGKFANLNIVE